MFAMFAFALSAFIFTGCEKEDDTDGNNSKSETFEGTASLSNCEKLAFKTDGTLLYYDVCFSGYDSKGHYTLQGNKLTLVYDDSVPDGDTDTFTIKEKTAERIVVSGEDKDWIITLKSDDSGSQSSGDLVGTWLCTYAKNDCGGDSEEYTESQGITWTFNADGTGSLRNVNGQTMSITYICKDKVITVNGSIPYTVISLTASSLKLERKATCSESWTFKRQ
jgi:hypothetical protein